MFKQYRNRIVNGKVEELNRVIGELTQLTDKNYVILALENMLDRMVRDPTPVGFRLEDIIDDRVLDIRPGLDTGEL